MTFKTGKMLLACVSLSTVLLATPAYAGNAFNKYPAQTTSMSQSAMSVQANGVHTRSRTVVKRVHGSTAVKRVVRPATTTLAHSTGPDAERLMRRFNKVDDRAAAPLGAMPVLFDPRSQTAR